jgi:hydroxyacylglutathione hydrolase
MAIEKCINEFNVDDVIFEEGSTGRELFVVLDGKIDIVKINGDRKTLIDPGQGRILRRDGRDRRFVPVGNRDRRSPQHPRDANQSCPVRLSGQSAAGVRADGHGCAQQAFEGVQRGHFQSGQPMSDRKPSPFPVLLDNAVCSLIQAAENVHQIRFKNRAANAYLVRGKSRNLMIDVGLSSNYPALLECLNHLGCPPDKIDLVILSHEHLDHIGAAYHFSGRSIIAAHRLAANKIMLRDDFSMLRKMFNEPNMPINVDIWLEEGNLIDLGNFRLNVMYTPGHTSACISLFDQDQGLLFAADTLMPGGVMGGVFGSGSISDYIQSLERLKGLNSKILLSGHGRLSDTPQDDVRIAIQRSHALLSDTAQLFDALDARSNFEPIMQSVRDLNKLDDG